jgi:hypothetical protein
VIDPLGGARMDRQREGGRDSGLAVQLPRLGAVERQARRLPSTDAAPHGQRAIADHDFLLVAGEAPEVLRAAAHGEKVTEW